MIPQDIAREHVLQAITDLRKNGWKNKNDSTKYNLLFNGVSLPPKITISKASEYAPCENITTTPFNGGAEANNFLIARGFVITDKNGRQLNLAPETEDDESSFPEGKEVYRRHMHRERDSQISKKAKARRLKIDRHLKCDACGFSFRKMYGPRGAGFIEAHHTIPLSELSGTTTTKISDFAMLCSNCHRMIHRSRPWMQLKDIKKLMQP